MLKASKRAAAPPPDSAEPSQPAPVALPVRAGDIVPFTPTCALAHEPRPVYHLRVPSISDRAAYRREIARRGGQAHDLAELSRVMRDGVRELFAAADQDKRLQAVDDWDALMAARGKVEGLDPVGVISRYNALAAELRKTYAPFAEIQADLKFLDAMQGLVAVQMFLTGWENGPGAFERMPAHYGVPMASEGCLDYVPADQWLELQRKAYSLTQLGHQTVKN